MNTKHENYTGRCPVVVFEEGKTRTFDSIMEASRFYKTDHHLLIRRINNGKSIFKDKNYFIDYLYE